MTKLVKTIEVFFLESLLKISLISITIVILVDYAFNRFDIQRSLIVNSAVLFAILSAYLLHWRGFFKLAVLWIGFLIMAAMFYQSIMAETITTSSMAVVMVIGFGFSILLREKLPLLLHIITLVGMAAVFTWLGLHPDQYGEPNASDIIVAGITYGVLYAIIAYSSYTLKQQYDQVFMELGEKAQRIEVQNEELKQSQENLSLLNAHLEAIVEKRTNEVKQQNERLIRYAHSNAHDVRGPVARLLGLTQLSKIERDIDYQFLFRRIEEQALEIDDVIRRVNRELEG